MIILTEWIHSFPSSMQPATNSSPRTAPMETSASQWRRWAERPSCQCKTQIHWVDVVCPSCVLNMHTCVSPGAFRSWPGWHEHSRSGGVCHCVWHSFEEARRGRRDPHQVLQLFQRGHHGSGLLDHVVRKSCMFLNIFFCCCCIPNP